MLVLTSNSANSNSSKKKSNLLYNLLKSYISEYEYNFNPSVKNEILLAISSIRKANTSEEFELLSNAEYNKANIKRLINNNEKDRYIGIHPFRYNRVVLNKENNYINASWILVIFFTNRIIQLL